MKPLDKDELFQNVSGFLKRKGIELKEGTYVQRIQKSCDALSWTFNAGCRGFESTKVELEKRLDQVRQVIHEKTAPRPTPTPPPALAPAPQASANPNPAQS